MTFVWPINSAKSWLQLTFFGEGGVGSVSKFGKPPATFLICIICVNHITYEIIKVNLKHFLLNLYYNITNTVTLPFQGGLYRSKCSGLEERKQSLRTCWIPDWRYIYLIVVVAFVTFIIMWISGKVSPTGQQEQDEKTFWILAFFTFFFFFFF